MSRSFVTDAVVATLERLGRGSCADIERWGGIAEGGSRAALWDLHAKGVARICAWERFHEKSAPRAIWALGSEPNAERPAPKPRQSRAMVAKGSPFGDDERTPGLPMVYPVKSLFAGGVNPWLMASSTDEPRS